MNPQSNQKQHSTQTLQLAEEHSLSRTVSFNIKSYLLTQLRRIKNVQEGIQGFQPVNRLVHAPMISNSESDLWNPDDNDMNRWLTAGKVENLRKAIAQIHGIEIPANKVFSFWKQVGKPSRRKGFVVGREIREGCIIPTIAGGICQLSNALYDAALKAGFEIKERHRHSKVIKGSLAEQGRDATVKWNYIDLQFSAPHDFRIEAELTADKLHVTFRSFQSDVIPENHQTERLTTSVLNDCFSCGNTACHQHPGKLPPPMGRSRITCLLDERWTEYEDYLQSILQDGDVIIVPSTLVKTPSRYVWRFAKSVTIKYVVGATIRRTLNMRRASSRGENIFQQSLQADERLALAMAQQIPFESTHLIISQNLLNGLMKSGQLGGRTWDVLMNRFPVETLQHQLDFAFALHPESTTLHDFRAPETFITWENAALTKANKIITPHGGIAKLFTHKSIQLPWNLPAVNQQNPQGKKILFPASSVARKGAIEVKRLALELDLEVIFTGAATEYAEFWKGVKASYQPRPEFHEIACVIYPAFVEHQPRAILRALAAGIPVISTKACGIQQMNHLHLFEPGDYSNMKALVQKVLNKQEVTNA